MTEHPITPPPELVQQWRDVPEYATGLEKLTMVTLTTAKLQEIATQAARWGANQELEACCEWLVNEGWFRYEHEAVQDLRTARRPKSPSLKEQALAELEILSDYAHGLGCSESAIRRALEALPE